MAAERDHVEHPEREDRALEMKRHVAMAAPDQVDDPIEPVGLLDILRREGHADAARVTMMPGSACTTSARGSPHARRAPRQAR